jgi:hypothetical protein
MTELYVGQKLLRRGHELAIIRVEKSFWADLGFFVWAVYLCESLPSSYGLSLSYQVYFMTELKDFKKLAKITP